MHQVELYRIYVGFDQLRNEKDRDSFFSIKTTFSLPTEQVDSLRSIGGELLDQSKCFQRLTDPKDEDLIKDDDGNVIGVKSCY